MTSTVGVITRAISVAADAAILLFTFLGTRSIFELSAEHRAQTTLMSMLLRNGKLSAGLYSTSTGHWCSFRLSSIQVCLYLTYFVIHPWLERSRKYSTSVEYHKHHSGRSIYRNSSRGTWFHSLLFVSERSAKSPPRISDGMPLRLSTSRKREQ